MLREIGKVDPVMGKNQHAPRREGASHVPRGVAHGARCQIVEKLCNDDAVIALSGQPRGYRQPQHARSTGA